MKTKNMFPLLLVFAFAHPAVRAQGIDEVKELIDNQQYKSAEIVLEKTTGSDNNPEFNYLLVKTYLEQDKKIEARTFINTHLTGAGSADAAPFNRIAYARYLLSTGNKIKANDVFRSLASDKKNQRDPALLMAMAEVSIEENDGDASLALDWLKIAQKRDKNNAGIDLLKGQAYRKLSDASNAYTSYQEALKKDPNNLKGHYLLGKIFTTQKNADVYLPHFLNAYELDPGYAPVLNELYKHYYYLNSKLAKKYLLEYIAHSDYSLQNEYDLIDILYLNGDYETAIDSASTLLSKEGEKVKPRLYKLMAYSAAKSGDSTAALKFINDYFDKEDPQKYVAPDFELRAQLTNILAGAETEVAAYYSIAAEMDTVTANKAKYATTIAGLYKKAGDAHRQAIWLGKLYQWKEKTNNIDLFNWGLAYYTAKEYQLTDSVFSLYTVRYPDDIYGYYWKAQANAAIDTSMIDALAIPSYHKVVEIGERDTITHKKMLVKAYGYLGGYEANITKDYAKSLQWFERYLLLDNDNADVKRYVEMLTKWIADKK
ncbi:MAG: tetratricopeptide repeat protein [Bacteroidota bacterium]|nr:tetratricopeptide repeat protein [Bacteroidota bacterium]